MNKTKPIHPLGTQAKILLSSVFGPYAQDDEYGSRKINPMELYHNQVTRAQGTFSLRMFHRSFGLLIIQSNIEAPCSLLDFPTLERFIEEIKTNSYDIVGISGIIPNIGKVKKMCELIRQYQPNATIVVGGHIANFTDLPNRIDVDHAVKGDGIRWFREFLGQDGDAPIVHPMLLSGFNSRIMGIPLPKMRTAAILLPSVGCPLGCNFCSTSAMFGGKGKHISFFETGEELFSIMCQTEKKLKIKSFFIMDENFLLHRKRALKLLELMEQHNKSWSLYLFSSAKVIKSYSMDQLIRLGVSWLWMGLEGEGSQYTKVTGVDTRLLVKELQSNGIRILGSTIIGLENHTPKNINQVIDYAVSHNTDFHQFMLYSPVPGTPLYKSLKKDGAILSEDECSLADSHGQYCFNFRHKSIKDRQEIGLLINAFQRDFETNGPSIARMINTSLMGWKKYKKHPDRQVRNRFKMECNVIGTFHGSAIWAMKKYYKNNKLIYDKINTILHSIYDEFGLKSKIINPILGRWIYYSLKKEEKKLSNGWTYEPQTVYEKNAKALELEKESGVKSKFKTTRSHYASFDQVTVVSN